MNKITFFLRHYNDTDNIEPIIYYFLAKKKKYSAIIIYYSLDYNFHKDPAIERLLKFYPKRVKVFWIGQIFNLSLKIITSNSLFSKIYKLYQFKMPWRRCHDVILGKHKNLKSMLLFEKGVKRFLKQCLYPKVVFIDQNRSHMIKGLTQTLRRNGVKYIVSLPVSPFTNINAVRSKFFKDPFSKEFKIVHDYSELNEMIVTDDHYINNLKKLHETSGIKNDFFKKSLVFGSIRYSHKWISKKKKFLNDKSLIFPIKSNKSKTLLFLLSHPATNSNWEAVIRSIKILGGFSNLNVIIKPHTRNINSETIELPSNCTIQNRDSSQLIEESDYILFWGTSVAIEGYIKKKIMLVADYVSFNKSVYKLYKAGIILECLDDLYITLKLLLNSKNNQYNLNNKKNIKTMLDAVVYAKQNRNIEKRYIDHMQDLLEKKI